MIRQPQNRRICRGDQVTFTASAPGLRLHSSHRARIRSRLTSEETKRFTPAQADLIQRMLDIPGVISLKMSKTTVAAHCYEMKQEDELQLRLMLISFIFESWVCEEWQRLKQFGPKWLLAA